MASSSAYVVFSLTVALIVGPASAERWEADLSWCTVTDGYLLEGDFNGDRRMDLVCHRSTDGRILIAHANADGQFNGTTWESEMPWCHKDDVKTFVGDFNGDERDDLLCHNSISGKKWLIRANIFGNFDHGIRWDMSAWCRGSNTELYIGDFNGDNRDDILCHHMETGRDIISYATCDGNFRARTGWTARLQWCGHSGADLRIGDFNGDNRADMLCHDPSNGNKWIAYANPQGHFAEGTGWESTQGWCFGCGRQLAIGDANGDDRDDLFCHDTESGHKWVALSNDQGNFNGLTSWEASLGWCMHPGAQFSLGDFNRDYKSDMLCHDPGTGEKWIIYSIPFYE